jgi:hypothetical protein
MQLRTMVGPVGLVLRVTPKQLNQHISVAKHGCGGLTAQRGPGPSAAEVPCGAKTDLF